MQNELTKLSERLLAMRRSGKVALMVVLDCVALPLCFLAAMMLRVADLDMAIGYGYYPYYYPYALTPLATIIAFALSGLYQAVIRFIDRCMLVKTGIGLAVVVIASFLLSYALEEKTLPRSALVIYWFIAFSYVVCSRLSVRAFLRRGFAPQSRERVGIFGAGEAGVQLAQAMRTEGKYHPVCFFDDKHALHSRNVAGLKVFDTSRAREIAADHDMRMVVLAIPAAPPVRRRQVVHTIRGAGLAVKMHNGLIALSDAAGTARSIRDVRIEDLLGRAPVPPQQDLFAKCVQGKNVLVTGAGGSIGSELCRQIMTLAPRHLHLLDHSEFALYSIEQELRTRFPGLPLRAHLGSVCDVKLMDRLVRQGRIDTIYHTAAYKHVPVVETNMAEGIRNNVVGAQVTVAAARKNRVATCVLVSTDKAVRPTNIMGASKRVAELIFQAAASTSSVGGTTFCMVRLGNVLGSSGSVIPLFQRQIEGGGPVTITDPEVVRYFMLIPEAAQLIIQAGAMARGGDLFVLDMGEPVKILDLAHTMVDMAGLTPRTEGSPHGDIEIKFVGMRPGEKLYEELLIGDDTRPSSHPRILCANEYSIHPVLLEKMIERLLAVSRTNDAALIRSAMKTIVTEYVCQSGEQSQAERLAAPLASGPQLRYRYLPWPPRYGWAMLGIARRGLARGAGNARFASAAH
jgi:FlaA1/EpsC-like NDP-sugar epimerase